MHISIIVAMDKNRIIGHKNNLPWHVSADLKHFKQTTMGKPVIMGRKTLESIGKALPGRKNIVITHNHAYRMADVITAGSIEEALAMIDPLCEEVMIIGGANLYQQILPLATRMYITHLNIAVEGDTYFPAWPLSLWQKCQQIEFFDEKSEITGCFELWEKI